MAKAIINGWFGKNNFGDDLMLKSTILYFSSKGVNYFFIPIDGRVDLKLPNKKIKTVLEPYPRKNIFKWVASIIKADYFIFGGGSIIHTYNRIRDYLYWYLPILISKIFGKKIIIWSQTIGPLNNKIDNIILKFLVNCAHIIYVRDKSSLTLISKKYSNKKTSLMPDISLFYLSKFNQKNRLYKKPTIIICPKDVYLEKWNLRKNNSDSNILKKRITKLIKILLNKTNFNIKLVALQSNEPHDDRILCKEIFQELKDPRLKILEYNSNINKIISELAYADLVISIRLHGTIVASALGTPIVNLSYSDKTKYFMKDLGLNGYCFDAWNFKPSIVAEKCLKLIKNKNIQKAALDKFKTKFIRGIEEIKKTNSHSNL